MAWNAKRIGLWVKQKHQRTNLKPFPQGIDGLDNPTQQFGQHPSFKEPPFLSFFI
jgi:hypothetical protein